MNISLRQVEMGPSQTMFITSSGTVLFTSYTGHDLSGNRSTTVITSINDWGSTVKVGLIKWNPAGPPSLYANRGLVELQTTGRGDATSTAFRGSDRRIYRWRKTNDVIVLAADGVCGAPIAVAYDDARSSSTVDSPGASVVLCIQPTGFHLLHEIVATFILFERLCEKPPVERGLKRRTTTAPNPRRETCVLDGDPRMQVPKDIHCTRVHSHGILPTIIVSHSGIQDVPPTKQYDCRDSGVGCHVPELRTQHRYLTRSTADLTGELLRRHKFPCAYGGFGDIWKCDWLKDSRVIEVAVKVMRTNLTASQKGTDSKRISRELKVWMRLEHECVLPLYGISFDFGRLPAMVCPWLEGGTLSKYLEQREVLPLHVGLHLLIDIADGLHYLHGCGIVHGDLTGSNVLIKDNGKACLSDFGLSRIFMEATGSSYLTSTVRGSVRWAAPELFEISEEQQKEPAHVLPTPQSDIYSFGSTMFQVLTGKVPFHYYKNDAQVLVALSRGLRPARPVEPPVDDVHWEFIHRCWTSQGKRASKNVRPCIEEVVDFLSVAKTRCSQD